MSAIPEAAPHGRTDGVRELLRRDARVWQGRRHESQRAESTGFALLDGALPGGGWPVGALGELYPQAEGIGEFALLAPLLARLTQQGRRVALVAPPYVPYSQALAWHGVRLDRLVLLQPERPADALWAMEQTLASRTVAAAIAWPRRFHFSGAGERELRRLQLAAATGGAVALLYRAPRESEQASPAALRIRLARSEGGLWLDVFKCRGAQPARLRLHSLTPDRERMRQVLDEVAAAQGSARAESRQAVGEQRLAPAAAFTDPGANCADDFFKPSAAVASATAA